MSIIGNEILAGAAGQGGYFLDNSLRFRSSVSAYLSRTPASAGNRKTFTLSVWFKRGALTVNHAIFSASDGTQNNEFLVWLIGIGSVTMVVLPIVAFVMSLVKGELKRK